MKRNNTLLKTAVALLSLGTISLLAGCGGGGGSSSSPSGPSAPTQFTQTVNTTAAQQTVTPAAYPNLSLVFPAGSIGGTGSLPLTVQPVTPAAAPQGQGVAPGTTFDFGPSGTTFTTPIQVTVTYDPTKLAPGTQQNTLQLETLQNGVWSTNGITNNVVNTANHTITADVAHFSTFGALATIINQFAGTYTGTYSGNGPNGAFNGVVDNVTVNPNGTLTGSADGGQETGSGTVSPTGAVSLSTMGTGSTLSGVTFTFSGTFTTAGGVNTVTGTFHDSAGESGTWTASNGSGATTLNTFAGTYTGVSSSDPSYGYSAALTNVIVTSSGAMTANVNEGNVIGTISGSVNSAGVVTASGGSTQDTYTFTGTFQTVNGVMEATGTYNSSGQNLPGHWVVVQSASTGAESQIAGGYKGTVANSTSSGTAGTIINANGTVTLADNSGDVAIGNATVNGNGQVVLTVTNPNNGNVITYTGTISGSVGSQTLSGNYSATESSAPSGASGTFNFTQFNPNLTFSARRRR